MGVHSYKYISEIKKEAQTHTWQLQLLSHQILQQNYNSILVSA